MLRLISLQHYYAEQKKRWRENGRKGVQLIQNYKNCEPMSCEVGAVSIKGFSLMALGSNAISEWIRGIKVAVLHAVCNVLSFVLVQRQTLSM